MTKVSKGEFRRAVCRGLLAGSECLWAANGEAWVKNGKTLALRKDGILGATYYLEWNA